MIWMCQVPRDRVLGYEWEATDRHSPTGGGDTSGYPTTSASFSRGYESRFVAKLTLGGMDTEEGEVGLATHPCEHGSCRSSISQASS